MSRGHGIMQRMVLDYLAEQPHTHPGRVWTPEAGWTDVEFPWPDWTKITDLALHLAFDYPDEPTPTRATRAG